MLSAMKVTAVAVAMAASATAATATATAPPEAPERTGGLVAAFLQRYGYNAVAPIVEYGDPAGYAEVIPGERAAASLHDNVVTLNAEWLASLDRKRLLTEVELVMLHEVPHEAHVSEWPTMTPEQQAWEEAAAESTMRDLTPAYTAWRHGFEVSWTELNTTRRNPRPTGCYEPQVVWIRGVSARATGTRNWKSTRATHWRYLFTIAPTPIRANMVTGLPPVPRLVRATPTPTSLQGERAP